MAIHYYDLRRLGVVVGRVGGLEIMLVTSQTTIATNRGPGQGYAAR